MRNSNKPVRGLSRLSARAAATHLATVDNAEMLLCSNIRSEFLPDRDVGTRPAFQQILEKVVNRLEELSDKHSAHRTATSAKPSKDPKSFTQHLFDTRSFKSFLQQVDTVDQTKADVRPELAKDRAAQAVILAETDLRQWFISKRLGEPQLVNIIIHRDTASLVNRIPMLMAQGIDALNDYMSAMRFEPDQLAWCDDGVVIGLATLLVLILGMVHRGTQQCEGVFTGFDQSSMWDAIGELPWDKWWLWPWEWMQIVFLSHWDGAVIIKRESIAGYALHAMESFVDRFSLVSEGKTYPLGPGLLQSHPMLANVSALADGFIRHCYSSDKCETTADDESLDEADCGPMYITNYAWILHQKTSVLVFRRICYQRLREAMDKSLVNVKILQRCFKPLTYNGFWPPQMVGIQYGVLTSAMSTYCTIQVRREHLLSDAYDELWRRQHRELLRPLRVKIVNEGEIGNDQGGISQEFFRLAVLEVTDPAYGMFKYDEAGRFDWFDPATLEPSYKFELFGLIVGLAVHNGYTLPLTFPLALYRNLCGQLTRYPPDIQDDWPDIVRNLDQLLHYDGDDTEDVFGLDFTYTYQGIGNVEQLNMLDFVPAEAWTCYGLDIPSDDSPLPVTTKNRCIYIETYVKMIALYSVHVPYTAFAQGFHTIMPPQVLRTTNPQNLKVLVEGMQQDVDSHALQQAATYGEDYNDESLYINMFWSVVHDLPQERKRKLLEFVTASDRIPVNGIESIPFKIERGADPNMLPTSHTCFGMLRLPEYANREVLERKLHIALDHTEGFGIV